MGVGLRRRKWVQHRRESDSLLHLPRILHRAAHGQLPRRRRHHQRRGRCGTDRRKREGRHQGRHLGDVGFRDHRGIERGAVRRTDRGQPVLHPRPHVRGLGLSRAGGIQQGGVHR